MIKLADGLSAFVILGILKFDGLTVTSTEISDSQKINYRSISFDEIPEQPTRVKMLRFMYRRFGIDPTKTRPSSEALLRRVRRERKLPRMNSLVDICNQCSLQTQPPYGLYDLDRVAGSIQFRRGGSGDEYKGIKNQVVHLDCRPALFDNCGPFRNPTSDSGRTMVTVDTTRALVVVFAPSDFPIKQIRTELDKTAVSISRVTGVSTR